jgi:anaerobic nitric oxide reductase transcription regulator
LRERGHDVLLVSGFFLEENRARLGLSSLRLSADAQAALLAYSWPGNVRELEHLIGRSALKTLAKRPQSAPHPRILTLTADDLGLNESVLLPPADSTNSPNSKLPLREAVSAYERRLIADSLASNGNNLASAARELGIDRANLSRLAKRLGLK